jgi:hypothetical protein
MEFITHSVTEFNEECVDDALSIEHREWGSQLQARAKLAAPGKETRDALTSGFLQFLSLECGECNNLGEMGTESGVLCRRFLHPSHPR